MGNGKTHSYGMLIVLAILFSQIRRPFIEISPKVSTFWRVDAEKTITVLNTDADSSSLEIYIPVFIVVYEGDLSLQCTNLVALNFVL